MDNCLFYASKILQRKLLNIKVKYALIIIFSGAGVEMIYVMTVEVQWDWWRLIFIINDPILPTNTSLSSPTEVIQQNYFLKIVEFPTWGQCIVSLFVATNL